MSWDLIYSKKIPPHNYEAEKVILGGILVDNKMFDIVRIILYPNDFYSDAHAKIYDKMDSLWNQGIPIDVIVLADSIYGATVFSLSSLMDGVPKSLNIESHARIVKEKSLLRQIILSATKIIDDCYREEEIDKILEKMRATIDDITRQMNWKKT